jgi:hypothetical protein
MTTMATKTRWTRIQIALAASAGILIIAFFGVCVHGVHRVDPQSTRHLIDEQLPLGSDVTRVIAFLDTNRIAHSEYAHHLVSAGIDRSSVGLFTGRIYIEFRFDQDGKLQTYRLQEIVRTFWT